MNSDFKKVKEFFDSMGVYHEINFGLGKQVEEGIDVITIGQAHMYFSAGRFVYTQADEMGFKEYRKETG